MVTKVEEEEEDGTDTFGGEAIGLVDGVVTSCGGEEG